jgi:TATA-box binding protein (TBP) (component of TFIID and TFIIIB)
MAAATVPVSLVFSAEQLNETRRRLERKLAEKVYYKPLTVRNVVATCWMGVRNLNLAAVATTMYGRLGVWAPKSNDRGKKPLYLQELSGMDQKFPSCVSRCREMGTTNSIFSSGQLVIGGAKSPEIALMSAWLCARRIRDDLGCNAKVYSFRVLNVVTTFGLGYRFNQALFYHDHHKDCGWDPDEFRGLSWEIDDDHRCILFDTGNAVLTGGETFDELREVYTNALPELAKYREGQEYCVYDPARLIKPESNREKKKNGLLKNRKERLLSSSYKKSEASYLERVRQRNAASVSSDAVVAPPPKVSYRTVARKRRAEAAVRQARVGGKKPRIDERASQPQTTTPSASAPRFEWTKNRFSSLLAMVPLSTTQPPLVLQQQQQQQQPLPQRPQPPGAVTLPNTDGRLLPLVIQNQIPKTSSVTGRRPASVLAAATARSATSAPGHTIMLGPNRTVVPWKHTGPMRTSTHSASVSRP